MRMGFLSQSWTPLERRLEQHGQLLRDRISLADMAVMPFVRQFANTDRDWFDAQRLPCLQAWLEQHLSSRIFAAIMQKHPLWELETGQRTAGR